MLFIAATKIGGDFRRRRVAPHSVTKSGCGIGASEQNDQRADRSSHGCESELHAASRAIHESRYDRRVEAQHDDQGVEKHPLWAEEKFC